MALSKADQEFYEEKLSTKSLAYLFGATCVFGTVLLPTVTYLQEGNSPTFTTNVALNLAIEGFLFGCMVATVMYLAFKFLLSMGWLPARR
jgi:hypothetical protein